MGKKYLIDTNIIIDFSENRLPSNAKLFAIEVIDNKSNISIILVHNMTLISRNSKDFDGIDDLEFINHHTI